jgi:uncharacterized protein (DUF58 family)
LDWGQLSPLRIRARGLADGLFTGAHRSRRRGGGVEFGGHRDYSPGDDLRHLDYRALLRHDRLLIRESETETESCVCLLMDGTLSMAYKSEHGLAAKQAYASLLAAALGRISVSTGDRLSLDWIGGEQGLPLPAMGGRDAFERLVGALEHGAPGGDAGLDIRRFGQRLVPIDRRAGRGSSIVMFSDLIDLPRGAAEALGALAARQRTVVAVQVLDPMEERFLFKGALKLKPSAGGEIIETDAAQARDGYLAALAQLRESWSTALHSRQGELVTCTTDEDPVTVLRRILLAIEGKGDGLSTSARASATGTGVR